MFEETPLHPECVRVVQREPPEAVRRDASAPIAGDALVSKRDALAETCLDRREEMSVSRAVERLAAVYDRLLE